LPHIASVLARDHNNKPLGYDYWDLDDFPFDSDTRRSPFYPLRRGTRAAGVLTLETPGTFLVPYRFPYPDVRRMVDLLADADRAGARIMLLSFEGRGRGDWKPFRRRATSNKKMLFVIAAGIGGRDLDRDPLFPASLGLVNGLVVTRAGDVLAGANWGANTVDIAVVAEEIATLGFDGNVRSARGASVAAARVAVMAARLLAINPSWTAERIRADIIAGARQPEIAPRRTRHGIVAAPPPPATTTDPS
jgi:hypothetical protein